MLGAATRRVTNTQRSITKRRNTRSWRHSRKARTGRGATRMSGSCRFRGRLDKRAPKARIGTYSVMQPCEHLSEMRPVMPSGEGCEDCLKIGGRWVHLRLCEICGHVGCCDSSPNRHATKHYHATDHPIVQSFQPGENWLWCYADELMMEPG